MTAVAALDPKQDGIAPFLDRLKDIVGKNVRGIVVYGSSLSQVTKSKTSTPDFFVVVDSYDAFYGARSHAILNRFLPPNIYHYRLGQTQAKYSVIDAARLERECRRPSDLYLVGRFSKKIAVGWQRDDAFAPWLGRVQRTAMETVARKSLPLLPARFTLDEFCVTALRLSYLGDVRVEAADKIQKLFDADPAFYRERYAPIVAALGANPGNDGTYANPARAAARLGVKAFLLLSQVRAQLRWPKAMFTASDWLDYILQKIERTQGIRIHLTEREKRFWYVYGWKHFYRLKKNKLIK